MFIFPIPPALNTEKHGIPIIRHKPVNEQPYWMTPEAIHTLKNGYLLENETPWEMYKRVANAAANRINRPDLSSIFFSLMWNGWLGAATPVLSNMGTDRGLPISCLTGDTWLVTPSGGKQIKDIQVGDLLLTHKGRYQPVTAKKSRMSTGDLYELAVGTRMTKTKITGNHPVLTNLGWVRVDELNPHVHFVAVNDEIEYVEKSHTLSMEDYCDHDTVEKDGLLYKKASTTTARAAKKAEKRGGIVNYYAAPPVEVEVTEELAWAIGLWLAEGSRCINSKKEPNGIRITMGVNEQPYVERWLDIIGKSFNVNGSWYASECQRENFASGKLTSWISATANGKFLGNLFCTEFGNNCKTKTIPQWVIDLPKPHLEALLQGLILGDGHTRPNGTWQLTLSNAELLLGVYTICLKLGILVSLQMQTKIRHGDKHITKVPQYTMRSLKTDSINLAASRTNSGIKFGSLRYCPIKHLQKVDFDEEVFDISVAEDNSFSAHGVIVHNCNSISVHDSLNGIFSSVKELAHLSSKGAGVGVYIGNIRGRGEPIGTGGYSEGVVPWCKIFDSTTIATSQGQTRRGATAMYLPFKHKDIREFIRMRRPLGDENQRCMNIHHAVCIDDDDMNRIANGNPEAVEIYGEILKTRKETGEPYIFYTGNVNNPDVLPLGYLKKGLTVETSNICSEITAYTDSEHSFVCCLSSMNLARWDEWKDTKAVYYATWFLEAVMQEYIDKAKHMVGFENAVRFAEKSRMLGLGVLGYHSLLQQKMMPFESFQTRLLNKVIFGKLADETNRASRDLAKIYGEPEWCKGTGLRHTHTTALAPTVSNSLICGHVSAGIEPLAANCFEKRGAKGVNLYYNPIFKQLLADRGKDSTEVWDSIIAAKGSVQHLDFLTDEEKEVFLTAREINQMEIVNQAVDRQRLMDKHRQGQAQSVNLFFTKDVDETYFTRVHYHAWKMGLKTLYYCRSESASQADLPNRTQQIIGKLSEGGAEECLACHG